MEILPFLGLDEKSLENRPRSFDLTSLKEMLIFFFLVFSLFLVFLKKIFNHSELISLKTSSKSKKGLNLKKSTGGTLLKIFLGSAFFRELSFSGRRESWSGQKWVFFKMA